MDRRRYLQAVGASLAPLVAGCSSTGSSETPTESPTGTDTDTATRTSTETEYADSPGDIEIPRYIELLPDKHLGGTERTDNASFLRINWEWYLETRDEPIEFGATDEEDWTLEPTEENFANAPEYDIIKAPVNAALVVAYLLENVITNFPNAGPEIRRQCGLNSDSSGNQATPEIDEIVSYTTPGVMHFLGADTDAFRDSLKENDSKSYEDINITGYSSVGEYEGRTILVSDESNRGVVTFESADENLRSIRPTLRRLAGYNEAVIVQESVKWALSRLSEAPVITGAINGGHQELAGSGYPDRGLDRLQEFGTLFQGFDTDGQTAEAQLIVSHTDGYAPNEEKLKRFYESNDATHYTSHHPDVSYISANWS